MRWLKQLFTCRRRYSELSESIRAAHLHDQCTKREPAQPHERSGGELNSHVSERRAAYYGRDRPSNRTGRALRVLSRYLKTFWCDAICSEYYFYLIVNCWPQGKSRIKSRSYHPDGIRNGPLSKQLSTGQVGGD